MIELPNPPVDLSDLYVRIKNNCEAIAIRQVQARLRTYTDASAALDGNSYKDWRLLPVKALNSLDKKLIAELAAMPPERVKGAPPQVPENVAKSGDDFF